MKLNALTVVTIALHTRKPKPFTTQATASRERGSGFPMNSVGMSMRFIVVNVAGLTVIHLMTDINIAQTAEQG